MAKRSPHANGAPVHEMLKALAEPQRIAVLRLVHAQELPAGEIAAHFKTSRQAISQHLKLMTDAGLLELRRDGTRRLYRIRQQAFGDLRTFLDIFWSGSLQRLKRRVETDKEARQRGQ